MQDVYSMCPVIENERYRLRLVSQEDCSDLLRVYSDEKAVPLLNSDNCHGDDFYYTTMERMQRAIDFWLREYGKRYYVRWAIKDKRTDEAIGTVELFRREAKDFFTDCGLLRLDLRSDNEHTNEIREILSLIVPKAFVLFDCSMIATKAVPAAEERICALKLMGFTAREEKLVGHDGTQYGDYYVRMKE